MLGLDTLVSCKLDEDERIDCQFDLEAFEHNNTVCSPLQMRHTCLRGHFSHIHHLLLFQFLQVSTVDCDTRSFEEAGLIAMVSGVKYIVNN